MLERLSTKKDFGLSDAIAEMRKLWLHPASKAATRKVVVIVQHRKGGQRKKGSF
jgi:hypothetical protein